jgi:hypothetical protein
MMARPVYARLMGDAELTGDLGPRATRLGDVRADLEPVTYRDHRCRNAFGSVLVGLLAARLAACSDVGSVGIVEAPILLVAGSR